MNIDALSNPTLRAAALSADVHSAGLPTAAQIEADRKSLSKAGSPNGTPTPSEVKRAASQFEAIILRQLLEPSMAPIMSGGMGGESSGGGMYGYLLTDVLATSLSQGGGLGWARMLEKQLSPAASVADNQSKSLTNS